MIGIIPEPKEMKVLDGKTSNFTSFNIISDNLTNNDNTDQINHIVQEKLWNLNITTDTDDSIDLILFDSLPEDRDEIDSLEEKQGYALTIRDNSVELCFNQIAGFTNAFSTLKQLLEKDDAAYHFPNIEIYDYPSIEKRSIATTFAWYAGYGRFGFDMQLWGLDEWKEYLDICSDFKINQLNMCMYGYWPFEYEEYPETTFKDIDMQIWNEESKNWINIKYSHPNLIENFLPELIEYAHSLSIDIYAYIGLNSYNGGYSNIYNDKRMKLPEGENFINDFDTLCLSDEQNIEYLKTSIRKVTSLGFDGIIFEESEESFWFCNCEDCQQDYLGKTESSAEAKHLANYRLLEILHWVIKDENPDCVVGLRAWREPPLEKDLDYLQNCNNNIPDGVRLFWAPGLYVGENEFSKWVEVFGKGRICARDTEANAVSSTMGRLFRIFKSNVLRADEETNEQFIENDINQHIGSVEQGVRGINGYMFEWYSYFLHFFAHAQYGWGSTMDKEEFYQYALESVFGKELAPDILYILKNILSIHESQISIFTTEFPFLRNKVNEDDIPTIQAAIDDWENIRDKIVRVRDAIAGVKELKHYVPHFDKILNSHKRNRYIYDLCLIAIKYDNAETEAEKEKYLKEIYKYNEKDFHLVKSYYFDVNPVDKTGVKACMYPYHEIKRVIKNKLDPDYHDDDQIYLGVEALGWLWL